MNDLNAKTYKRYSRNLHMNFLEAKCYASPYETLLTSNRQKK